MLAEEMSVLDLRRMLLDDEISSQRKSGDVERILLNNVKQTSNAIGKVLDGSRIERKRTGCEEMWKIRN